MPKYEITVECRLKYTVEAKNNNEAEQTAIDLDLPEEYVEDTFEVVKIKRVPSERKETRK
jgi:hypothetical protein